MVPSPLCHPCMQAQSVTRSFWSSLELSLLKPGMAILADTGFLMDYCVPCKVYRLAYLSKREQMLAGEVKETQSIARLRVHVERLIFRVKQHKLFDSHPSFYHWEHQPVIHCCLPTCELPEWPLGKSMGKGLKSRQDTAEREGSIWIYKSSRSLGISTIFDGCNTQWNKQFNVCLIVNN